MSIANRSFCRLSALAVTFGLVFALGLLGSSLRAQERTAQAPSVTDVGGVEIRGVPHDWSHHQLVFSNPGTEQQAIENGTHDRWLKIVNDPRYVMQQLQRRQSAQGPYAREVREMTAAFGPRNVSASGGIAGLDGMVEVARPFVGPGSSGPQRRKIKNDWSQDLGAGTMMNIGTYPAKWSFNTGSASCANDFVVFATGVSGTSTAADILAYNNLYSGCSGVSPQTYWQYNTGGDLFLSPALSLDGTQVAFVQDNTMTAVSSLVVMKWTANSSLVTLSSTSPSSYRSCTAPCMTVLTLNHNGFDANSAPFYDYTNDTLYVGDNSGYLHKFTGVFNGTPGEAASPWPVLISPSYYLASPVLDPVSGNVFLGTVYNSVVSTGGLFYAVSSSTGAVSGGSRLDYNLGIYDAPLVDANAQMVYAFVGEDGRGESGVYQFPTSLASSTEAEVPYPGDYPLFSGAFDNIYFTSNSSSPTGHLYMFGEAVPFGASFPQRLVQVSINSNSMSSTVATSTYYLGEGSPPWSSPVTEFYNTSTGIDSIFMSVQSAYQGCSQTTGCLFGFNVTSGNVPTSPTGIRSATGGTGGIIVDNSVGSGTVPGASQIYFTTLEAALCGPSGIGLCAVQASQSAP
jgi:hypothetical protein